MKQILIACSMMEDEINKIYEQIKCEIPIIWIDRGFHNTPRKLKEKLQDLIDAHQDCNDILLTFGLCGNGTEGIVSSHARLIMPKFDDCINMLLCCGERSSRGLAKTGSIYLTKGWTLDEESITGQYEKAVEDYGKEAADEIMEMMYEHYDTISVIDTGSYDVDVVMEYAKKAARLLNVSTQLVEGTVDILRKLLTGDWDNNFIIQNPKQPIKASDFEFPS